MTDTPMVVDEAPSDSGNAMAALMANVKGKAKASNGDSNGKSVAELKAANEREGLPWSVGELLPELRFAIAKMFFVTDVP